MNNASIKINTEQCEKIGLIIAGLQFRPEFLKRDFITFEATAENKLKAYLLAAAICHQTHGLINRKLNLRGWEYLEYAFAKLAQENAEIFNFKFLANAKPSELVESLKIIFADDGIPANCTLDRLGERAELMIDIAKEIELHYRGKVSGLIEESGGYLLNDGHGLYELLARMDAFSDPQKKKSTVFLQHLEEVGLYIIKDEENLIPPMDYHMQRVLLRTGCVEVEDEELKDKLRNRTLLESDSEIRDCSVDAVKLIAKLAKRRLLDLDFILWSLGRSCCNENLLCKDHKCSKYPCTFEQTVKLKEHNSCVFQGACFGCEKEEYRSYWQPNVKTVFY